MDRIRAGLAARGARTCFVDQRFGPVQELQRRSQAETLIRHDGRGSVDLASVRAAYIRPIATEQACTFHGADDPARVRVAAVEVRLLAWADCGPATVINRPSAMAANNSKPYQLAHIARFGFEVPDTVITTSPDVVRAFRERHRRIIYKSISGVRSIVRQLADSDLARLDDVAACPTQFQQYIEGADVRVHVVGDEAFGTEISSPVDDYRYASRSDADVELHDVELPAHIAEACCRMVRGMDLLVAGIDLRRTPDNRWVCFEVNPSPAFPYYDRDEPRIESAIVSLLRRLGAS